MGGLDMPPDITEIDADIHKISALTPDSFMQWDANQPAHLYSPRQNNPNSMRGPPMQQQFANFGSHNDTSSF